MKASVASWKVWGKDQEFPVLILETTKEELAETEALRRLEEISSGLRGLGYRQSVAAINNEGDKHLRTSFVIDLGTLLTLCSEIQLDKSIRTLATGWLQSLADKYKSSEKSKIDDELRCRCGQVFRNKKIRNNHAKKCSVIQQDMPMLRRVKSSLQALKGATKSDGEKESKTGKLRRAARVKTGSKVSGKTMQKAGRKKATNVRRAKARRT